MAKQKKRADGRLQKSFTFEGRRFYVYGRTPQELVKAEYDKRLELEQGVEDRENPTLDRYYERFTERRRSKVKETTIRNQGFMFQSCADVEIDATGRTLGSMRIQNIRPYDIQAVQAELEKSDMATGTVNLYMAHLSHVFSAAVKDETIMRNPCICIDRVKQTEKPARETIHRALTEEETRKFFKAAKDSYYEDMFILMIQTGIRVGELGALNEFDVDTREMILHVNKTVTRNETGAYVIGDTPKTKSGTRDIPLTQTAIDAIRSQKIRNMILFGKKSSGPIFKAFEGGLLREQHVNGEIKRICEKIGMEKFTCHAFRATFATRFIEQRPQDYKILSEILGHSNINITLNLYTHVMKESKIIAMRGINIAI